LVFREQYLLNGFGVLGGIAKPSQDGVFFVPFDTGHTTDPASFRQEGQGFDDLVFGRATPIENRSFGFGKRGTTRLASVSLSTCSGLAKSDNVLLPFALPLAIIATDLIWTVIAHSGQLGHFTLLVVVDQRHQYSRLLNNAQEGDYLFFEEPAIMWLKSLVRAIHQPDRNG
jgi:hypothetical protein